MSQPDVQEPAVPRAVGSAAKASLWQRILEPRSQRRRSREAASNERQKLKKIVFICETTQNIEVRRSFITELRGK